MEWGTVLPDPADAVLMARNLACLRGERAVFAGLDVSLAQGSALLLTGANGAGKSTLLRILAGLLRPAEGAVLWQGEDIAADPAAHARRLRYLSHQDALKPALTVAENLAFFAALWGGAVAGALDAVGLAPLADLPARVLSSGQRRRLALARLALAPAPLWLLDEPTTGLDAASVERLRPLLAAHRAAGGIVIAATHIPLPLADAQEFRL
ncbi:heme ABC exporter ATP-binding protein CcmA [Roseomonas oryzicola]|uniref:Heme ABC exporter ATP-binding protein CcmA n=3 Tax=Neoroseomonas oryzicola TaxID=535904 RepID=A0A9X9WPV0_9PROT|nr:heme ABC exporter ATP-binding protein CcmA [Neoroseomonas oryzicola]MBR0662360.1 heme ABC exporter ATP-binding protein CcmA [Neoroseomonas oryzicola]NKE19474.1 heme ABC exporter ATP-binding protein CcmA [Neoroseomonas oryzicola]